MWRLAQLGDVVAQLGHVAAAQLWTLSSHLDKPWFSILDVTAKAVGETRNR
jgi:uncharacterized phage-associated protein